MLISPPASPTAPHLRPPSQTGTRRPRRLPPATAVADPRQLPKPQPPSTPSGDDDEAETMRRTRSKTDDAGRSAGGPSSMRRPESAVIRRDSNPRRPSSAASLRPHHASSSGLTTPRSPSGRRQQASSPTPYAPLPSSSASTSTSIHAPHPRRISTGPYTAATSTVLRDVQAPPSPSSPPSPFLRQVSSGGGPPDRPSSTSLLGRPAGQRHVSTALCTPSSTASRETIAGRPTRRRISLNLPTEGDRRAAAAVAAGLSGRSVQAKEGRSTAGKTANAEGCLRDVLGRFERSASSSSASVGSSTATLGRVRKTFLRGKSTPTAVRSLPTEGAGSAVVDRELAARESERAMARWADGGDEVPQAVLLAEEERRSSPLGEPFGNGGDANPSLRARPAGSSRVASSPAFFGGPRSVSPAAIIRTASPFPPATSPASSFMDDRAAAALAAAAGKKRPHSTSTSSIASSSPRRQGGGLDRSLASYGSIRSELALPLPPPSSRAHLGSALRALTTPAPPSLAHSTAGSASPVFARPSHLPPVLAHSGRTVSQPASQQHRHHLTHCTTATQASDDDGARSPSSSFDLDRCVAACRAVGDGWVSFAQVGVGAVPEEAEDGDEGPAGKDGGRGWWSWLGGGAGQAATAQAAPTVGGSAGVNHA